jgi:hypothetical protein
MDSVEASITIWQCVRTLAYFRFFAKRSLSQNLNPTFTKSCEPSHRSANWTETNAPAGTKRRILATSLRRGLMLPLARSGRPNKIDSSNGLKPAFAAIV